MLKHYKVAGHVFSLEVPDDCPVWNDLTNYSPFEVSDCEGNNLFSLSVVKNLPVPEKTPFFLPRVEPDEPVINIYSSGENWWIESSPRADAPICGHFLCARDFSSAQVAFSSVSLGRFVIDNALMLLFAFRSAPFKTLELHSSVTVRDGRAYLFLAKSGTGKSTQSRMWLENIPGSTLLNDDNPVLRVGEDGTVIIYGTPWSGKTPCYKNESAVAGAFVGIRRCRENKITRLSLLESYVQLSNSSSGFRPLDGMAEALHETLSYCVQTVPSYVLDCRPDPESAQVCSSQVCER